MTTTTTHRRVMHYGRRVVYAYSREMLNLLAMAFAAGFVACLLVVILFVTYT